MEQLIRLPNLREVVGEDNYLTREPLHGFVHQ